MPVDLFIQWQSRRGKPEERSKFLSQLRDPWRSPGGTPAVANGSRMKESYENFPKAFSCFVATSNGGPGTCRRDRQQPVQWIRCDNAIYPCCFRFQLLVAGDQRDGLFVR